jgi:hypothetical protein
LDKITSEIGIFWDNLKLFKERWEKIVKATESNNEAIRKLNISTRKLIEEGEKIKNRENVSPEKLFESEQIEFAEKDNKNINNND